MRRSSLILALSVAGIGACSPSEPASSAPAPSAPAIPEAVSSSAPVADPALDSAIASILGEDAVSTRSIIRVVGEEENRLALVYLTGMTWCGSGGCNLLILRPTASGWEAVGNVARVRPPVRVLTTTSNGLPDVGVTVSGGGGPPAYEARLTFDGRAYPRFPPDEAVTEAAGTVVITDADIAPPAE